MHQFILSAHGLKVPVLLSVHFAIDWSSLGAPVGHGKLFFFAHAHHFKRKSDDSFSLSSPASIKQTQHTWNLLMKGSDLWVTTQKWQWIKHLQKPRSPTQVCDESCAWALTRKTRQPLKRNNSSSVSLRTFLFPMHSLDKSVVELKLNLKEIWFWHSLWFSPWWTEYQRNH